MTPEQKHAQQAIISMITALSLALCILVMVLLSVRFGQ